MDQPIKPPSKTSVVAKVTRTWTSGTVSFAVLCVEGHPESTYIALEKNLMGKKPSVGVQRFRLRLRDWNHLKQLIETELPDKHRWVIESSGLSLVKGKVSDEIASAISEKPELIEKLLELPNLKNLSSVSFEHLNRLAMKIYQVQSKNLELVLKNLSKASPEEFVQFATLLTDLRLGQVATLANLVKQKLEIIELFEKLSSTETAREREVHKLIEDNPWIANKTYEVLASDRTLSEYLSKNVKEDLELRKRPDLIVRRIPNHEELVLIELKAPNVKLRPAHVGQILEYKALIQQFRPNTKSIDCYLFGYEKHQSFTHESKDVTIKTFSELGCALRDEYQAYLKVLEENSREVDILDNENEIPF
jgi:hypothetical protein